MVSDFMMQDVLATFTWDPDRNLFVFPYLHHPITWYGFLFATGFLIGYFLIRKLFGDFLVPFSEEESKARLEAVTLADRLVVLAVIGGILGARLGHVFFYGWPYYRIHPTSIFKIWEGGLASHGGAIGVLIALTIFFLLSRRTSPRLTFLMVLDVIVVPTALLGSMIRVGNFMNQEITGIPTTLPWGVIFLHPLDGLQGIAVHPVQLYESLFYFLLFLLLLAIWFKNKAILGRGVLSGLFFFLVFGFRFVIEYLKAPQSAFDERSWISTGQLLSIPFIILGAVLLLRDLYARKKR